MSSIDKFKDKYRIKSTRLPLYDYGQNGYYLVTICTKDRLEYFGNVVNCQMVLTEIGNVALEFWQSISKHFSFVILDEFIIMPNHIHGILIIQKGTDRGGHNISVETGQCPVSTTITDVNLIETNKSTLSSIIGSYKSICSRQINK
jgi:hypothetical protein